MGATRAPWARLGGSSASILLRRSGQHRLRRRPGGDVGHAGLRGIKARRDRAHQDGGRRSRSPGHAGERRVPGASRYAHDPCARGTDLTVGERYQAGRPSGRYATVDEIANIVALHGGRTLLYYTSIGAVARRMFAAFDAEGRSLGNATRPHARKRTMGVSSIRAVIWASQPSRNRASMPAGEVHRAISVHAPAAALKKL